MDSLWANPTIVMANMYNVNDCYYLYAVAIKMSHNNEIIMLQWPK